MAFTAEALTVFLMASLALSCSAEDSVRIEKGSPSKPPSCSHIVTSAGENEVLAVCEYHGAEKLRTVLPYAGGLKKFASDVLRGMPDATDILWNQKLTPEADDNVVELRITIKKDNYSVTASMTSTRTVWWRFIESGEAWQSAFRLLSEGRPKAFRLWFDE